MYLLNCEFFISLHPHLACLLQAFLPDEGYLYVSKHRDERERDMDAEHSQMPITVQFLTILFISLRASSSFIAREDIAYVVRCACWSVSEAE